MERLRTTGRALLLAAMAGGVACVGAAGCFGEGAANGDVVPPLNVPADTWTWVDVPGMTCDDGTETGIAVNRAPGTTAGAAGGDLLVYFMGGGACWDATTCLLLNTAVHGPFGRAQWSATGLPQVSHSLDRARASNPFRTFSLVFVPYCTGDLHAGSNVASYDGGLGARPYRHVGRRNVEALLPRVRATWPSAARVVVSGSSAGGYGATLNYDLLRKAYPDATVALLDDAGPLLEENNIPAAARDAWYSSWHIGDVVTPLCSTCMADMSTFYPALAALYPADRMALLSSLQDQVIRTYFQLSAADFEVQLRKLITDRVVPAPHFESFVIPGQMHTLLGMSDTVTAGGLTLEAWLGQMVSGDAAWTSAGP